MTASFTTSDLQPLGLFALGVLEGLGVNTLPFALAGLGLWTVLFIHTLTSAAQS